MHHSHWDSLLSGIIDAGLPSNDTAADVLFYLLLLNGRAFLLLLCCLCILRLVKSSAATRHFLAILSIAAVALLPFTSRLIPAFDITIETSYLEEIPAEPQTLHSMASVSGRETSPFTPGLFYLGCLAIYFLGFAVILAKLLLDNLKLFLLVKLCRPVRQRNWLDCIEKHRASLGIQRCIELRHSDLNASPSTWGAFRPVILLPNSALQWPAHLIESTVLHELAHIKRYDWLVQQAIRCVYAFYWLNPLFRVAMNKVFIHAETACDDLAINAGVPNLDYAESLVNVAERALHRQHYRLAAIAMAAHGKQSPLGDRVLAILNQHECRTPVTKTQILIALSVFLCVLLPLASVRATFVERATEPPGPVIFEEKLARFSYDHEYDMSLIPVDILPQNEFLETTVSGKPDEATGPGEKLAELKKILHAGNTPPPVNTAATIAQDKDKPTRNEKTLPPQGEHPRVASANADTILKKHIEKTLSRISQTLGAPALSTDAEPAEPGKSLLSHSPINMVVPEYPRRALTRGIEGEVTVEYSIDEQGKVVAAEILSSHPSSIFNRHVLKAIKNSTFNPRRIDGNPVPAEGLIEKYVFVLES